MDRFSTEHDDPVWKSLIGKLQRGKESAIRLSRLPKPYSGHGSGASSSEQEQLIAEIARSFNESISIVRTCENRVAGGDARRVSPVDRSSKAPDKGKKRIGAKDRRGCYRRRNSAESWVTMSPTTEDEYAWRKYGQKEILNTNFPRCYFRCTHKTDQHCKATKQVQKLKDDPPVYQITYFGHHTCQNTLMRTPQIISEPEPMDQCSYFLSFETKTLSTNPPPPGAPPPISPTAVVNQEFKEETHSGVTECLDSSSLWHDISESSGLQKLHETAAAASNSRNGTAAEYNDQEVVSRFHEMEAFSTNFGDYEALYMDDDLPGFTQFPN